MQIVLGRRYKLDTEKLKWYSQKYNWEHDYGNMIKYDYITPISILYYVGITTNAYDVKETPYFYPEDCLIDERELKLKKILCK